jgi:1-deoxy-D-xylulose-5-phosphate synthase
MVATAAAIDDRPSALRFPRGDGIGLELPAVGEPLEIGRGRIMRRGDNLAFLCYGARLGAAMQAAEILDDMGIAVSVADARFAKPIDDHLVSRLLREHAVVMTVEEGAIGGFATQVADSIARQGLERLSPRLRSAMLPDQFIEHDSPAGQLASVRLDAAGLVRRALRALGKQRAAASPRPSQLNTSWPY